MQTAPKKTEQFFVWSIRCGHFVAKKYVMPENRTSHTILIMQYQNPDILSRSNMRTASF